MQQDKPTSNYLLYNGSYTLLLEGVTFEEACSRARLEALEEQETIYLHEVAHKWKFYLPTDVKMEQKF